MDIITLDFARENNLKYYFTGKPCKHGHIDQRLTSDRNCVSCKKKWYEENKERTLAKKRKFYRENPEIFAEYNKSYRDRNKESLKKSKRNYAQKNKDKINAYHRKRYAENPTQKLRVNFYRMLRRTLTATDKSKMYKTEEHLGYTNEDLKTCLESKFIDGMSWGNYGEWVIDHAYPINRYVEDGFKDPATINNLDNLIPMWASHNMSKKDKTLEEFLTDQPEMYSLYGHFLK